MTQMNLSVKKIRLRQTEQTCGCQGGGRVQVGMDREFGVSRCRVLYIILWIDNKVLLWSTGNYIQYPVINHNGKNIF